MRNMDHYYTAFVTYLIRTIASQNSENTTRILVSRKRKDCIQFSLKTC